MRRKDERQTSTDAFGEVQGLEINFHCRKEGEIEKRFTKWKFRFGNVKTPFWKCFTLEY